MLRIPVIIILICSCISFSFAQDSTKKASTVKPAAIKPAVVKPPVVKPTVKYKPYKYAAPKTTVAKPNVVVTNPPAQQLPVKRDSMPTAMPNDKSLNGQYQYLLTKVYHYQQPLIAALWKNTTDSLNLNRRKLKEAQTKVAAQSKLIDSLKADTKNKDQSLNAQNAKVDEVTLLGIPMTKTNYNFLMWGLVIVFGATAIIVIARSGSYSREAKYRIGLYNELEEEYKTFKSKANEKEKKLARELQTERNKNDELSGRG